VRIARYTTGEDPTYGIVQGEAGTEWIAEIQGDPLYQPIVVTGNRVLLDDARLLAPVIPRSKVIGIGKNYAAHVAEMGGDAPGEPLMFLMPNTAVVGPGDPVVLPRQSSEVHYEGELAVVISRMCKDVPVARVADVIFGYTCANDVTARDLQRSDGQWARAKGFDTFCPLGPWIETELDTGDLSIVTRLDGEVVQDGRTADMTRDVAALVAHASQAFTCCRATSSSPEPRPVSGRSRAASGSRSRSRALAFCPTRSSAATDGLRAEARQRNRFTRIGSS